MLGFENSKLETAYRGCWERHSKIYRKPTVTELFVNLVGHGLGQENA